jgi:hypothetical protein
MFSLQVMGMFRLLFTFTDTGSKLVPDEDSLSKAMATLMRSLVQVRPRLALGSTLNPETLPKKSQTKIV